MPKVGIIYGMENTFPSALVERINSKKADGVTAESVRIGTIRMAEPTGYRVIVDRISQDIEFYRTYLKNAVLNGAIVINNPFWWSADDKFFNYSVACKIGVAVPKTVVLPQKEHPPGTTVQSMRNLMFPLNWNDAFEYVGFPAFLKPLSRTAWIHVQRVNSPQEFFDAYDRSGSSCMILQSAIPFSEYYRCYVVGGEHVRVMKYDPNQAQHLRYSRETSHIPGDLHERLVHDCVALCRALGYDFNMVELAVQEGKPYAIDFLNPAPDADVHSVGPENFEWVVERVAQLTIARATSSNEQANMGRNRLLCGSPEAVAVAGA